MKTGRNYKFWFCTGSQDLYGDECLRKVAEHSRIIVEELNKSGVLPFELVWKPTLITNELIRKTFNEANADEDCAGVITWMHTFSPAKSWILGLKEYRKPLCHLHTQFNEEIPYDIYAAFYYMKACYPYLAESHGSVINFASGAGLFGNFGQSAYAAAKEGIRGMSRVAATEWGKDGINVNVVCPLAWTAKLEQFRDAYPDAFKANVKMPPMGHYGNAETEIGRVCVQLAMPDFKYMSGETLTLEGGMGQRP